MCRSISGAAVRTSALPGTVLTNQTPGRKSGRVPRYHVVDDFIEF